MDELNGGFGDVPIKREGTIMNPDDKIWECDLRTCAKCAKKYSEWKALYDKEQKEKNE